MAPKGAQANAPIMFAAATYAAGLGLPGSSATVYDRSRGSVAVTQTFGPAGDGNDGAQEANQKVYVLTPSAKQTLDDQLDQINFASVAPKYAYGPSTLGSDASPLFLALRLADGETKVTEIDQFDSAHLPAGIVFLFSFFNNATYAQDAMP